MPGIKKSTSSVNAVKKRIRGIERLLAKDVSEEIREKKTTELKELRDVVKYGGRQDKYKKVRFVEMTKVKRVLAKLRKASAEGGDSNVEHLIEQAESDLLYIEQFPPHRKYISLFVGAEANADMIQEIRDSIVKPAPAEVKVDDEMLGCKDDLIESDPFFL